MHSLDLHTNFEPCMLHLNVNMWPQGLGRFTGSGRGAAGRASVTRPASRSMDWLYKQTAHLNPAMYLYFRKSPRVSPSALLSLVVPKVLTWPRRLSLACFIQEASSIVELPHSTIARVRTELS